MRKTSALANALKQSGARVAHVPEEPVAAKPDPAPAESPRSEKKKSGRVGTKPITLHLNEETRRQLKALAGEEGRTVESMGAEAFNLLFARYRKPEVSVAKGPRSAGD